MLHECRASVKAQEGVTFEHLILVDEKFHGCSRTVNQLAAQARGEWLFLLADDDYLLPGCLAAHVEASDGADIVYSPPVVEGEPEQPFHGDPPGIPATSLICGDLWRALGGYDESLVQVEDFNLYERALAVGAVFKRLEAKTWVYRLGHPLGNKSRGKLFR